MQWQQAPDLLSKLCMAESRQPDHMQRSVQRLRDGHAMAACAGTLEQVRMAESRQTRSPSAQRSALARTGMQWKVALDLLREMSLDRVAPDTISFSAAISACEPDLQWQQALELLSRLCMTGLRQTRSALAQRARWRGGHARAASAGTLEQVAQDRVAPNPITCSAAISACENGNVA